MTYRDRDKIKAEEFAKLKNVNMAPSIGELRVYDDKGAQQLEYNEVMPPALYSSNEKKEARKYARETTYPFISKAIEGAHSSNVRLIRNQAQAITEIEAIFSKRRKRSSRQTFSRFDSTRICIMAEIYARQSK